MTSRWQPEIGQGESTYAREIIYGSDWSHFSSPLQSQLWTSPSLPESALHLPCCLSLLLWAWIWGEMVCVPGASHWISWFLNVTNENDDPTSRVVVKTLRIGGGAANLKEGCHPHASLTPTSGQSSPGLSANSSIHPAACHLSPTPDSDSTCLLHRPPQSLLHMMTRVTLSHKQLDRALLCLRSSKASLPLG